MFTELIEYARRNGLVTEPGFSTKRVTWLVDVSPSGAFRGVRRVEGNSALDRFERCPHWQQPEMMTLPSYLRTLHFQTRQAAHFLLDACTKVADWSKSEETRDQIKDKHVAFKALIQIAAQDIELLKPVRKFLSKSEQVKLLRTKLKAFKANPDSLITFAVDGAALLANPTWHKWWQEFRSKVSPANSEHVISVVSGAFITPVSTHPKITRLGVGAKSTGASLVSTHEDAYQSHGFRPGFNAGFTATDATAYQAALDHLLRPAPTLGQMKIVHWFDQETMPERNPFWALFAPNEETENTSLLQRVRALSAEPPLRSKSRVAPNPQLFTLALTGNRGRVRVKEWQIKTWSEFVLAVKTWFDDLEIVHTNGIVNARMPSLEELLRSLRQGGEGKHYLEQLRFFQMPLWQAASQPTTHFPEAIVSHVLNAIKSDVATGEFTRASITPSEKSNQAGSIRFYAHFALLKTFLRRQGDSTIQPSLNATHANRAYQVGRLGALLFDIQRHAFQHRADHIQDRLFANAIAMPAGFLEPLVWTTFRHLEMLSLTRPGYAPSMLARLGNTWKALGGNLPTMLMQNDQAYFVLGYHQQLAAERMPKLTEDDTTTEKDAVLSFSRTGT